MAYTIEEEQEINQLKEFWKEYGKTIVASLILGAAGVFGWHYWQNHQATQIMQTSAAYDQLRFTQDDDQTAKVQDFVQANGKTAYAVFALLEQAKDAVNRQAFDEAQTALQAALQQSQDDTLTALTALRLAVVQFQLQQWDTAAATLDAVKAGGLSRRKFLLLGDISAAKGEKDAARRHYEAALQTANPVEQQLIRLKLNNL